MPLDFRPTGSKLPAPLISQFVHTRFIMAVVIRLRREGTKDRPFYRIVAADKRFRRDGRFLEVLGTHDPMAAKGGLSLSLEKVDAWLAKGAAPSESVASLVKRARAGA
jgi:small subunit ribosomal protein S16